MISRTITALFVCFLFTIVDAHAQTPAFPSAEGFGRFAKGGRGGQVIHVTNLNDSGPGSFRAAVEASGPRTVVFDVSGNIDCRNSIEIINPYLTIAGQTAPGEGVTVMCQLTPKANDLIIRHIRVRPGVVGPGTRHPNLAPGSASGMSVIGQGCESRAKGPVNNVILDHVSISWTSDDLSGVYCTGVDNITYQNSIIAESIQYHDGVWQGKGFLMGGTYSANTSMHVSFHHNLLANNQDRNPFVHAGQLDFVNNVIYNHANPSVFAPFTGQISINAVGNYYIRGPISLQNLPPNGTIRLHGGADVPSNYKAASSIYVNGNLDTVSRPNDSLPQDAVLWKMDGGFTVSATRLNFPMVTTTSAGIAKEQVLAGAGASKPARDATDARIVNAVLTGTGKYIAQDPAKELAGGYPVLPIVQRPAGYDSDRDGMPDQWEAANGLSTNVADEKADPDGDGYTNLEEFLNDTTPVSRIIVAPPTKLHLTSN